ncbi:zinc-binding dehydrogenase [Paraburkholderia sediminicola]|uniref:zinc-dependent alcohol dehydrogenase family protein n=1 Tax=Paraburkholderia sediminicola TaxID=458836 RepID=UPI0038B8B401
MIGAVFKGERVVELMTFDDPTPGDNDVVLEMKASGICGSDLKSYRGTYSGKAKIEGPVIAGHEPCGVVVAAGRAVTGKVGRVGSRVMVHHYKGCGCCNDCMSGWTQLCTDRKASYGLTAHGGHAKYLRVPADTLIELPEELSFEAGAAISCGSGTAWGALQRLGFSNRHPILVVGQGPVGLATTQFATAMGGEVIALDINDARLERSKLFGATHTVNTSKTDALAAVGEITGGKGVPMVVDTSGSALGSLDAVRCASVWGQVALIGMGGTVTLDVSEHLIRKQLTVQGSWTFSKAWQADCAEYVRKHRVQVDALFTHRWSLEQASEAYELFDAQKTGKSVIVFQ